MPNIQIDVGRIFARAIDFYVPTPSKIAKTWDIIFFAQQQRHLLDLSEIKMPNIGPLVAAAKSGCKSAHKQHLC